MREPERVKNNSRYVWLFTVAARESSYELLFCVFGIVSDRDESNQKETIQ